jgi:hypothetical protein
VWNEVELLVEANYLAKIKKKNEFVIILTPIAKAATQKIAKDLNIRDLLNVNKESPPVATISKKIPVEPKLVEKLDEEEPKSLESEPREEEEFGWDEAEPQEEEEFGWDEAEPQDEEPSETDDGQSDLDIIISRYQETCSEMQIFLKLALDRKGKSFGRVTKSFMEKHGPPKLTKKQSGSVFDQIKKDDINKDWLKIAITSNTSLKITDLGKQYYNYLKTQN